MTSRVFSSPAQKRVFEAIESLPAGSVPATSLAPDINTLAQEGLLDQANAGRTLLGLACGLGLAGWTKALIKAGANPNASDPEGNTPLHLLASYHHPELAPLLLKAGADPQAKNQHNNTPLDLAVGRHAVRLLDILTNHLDQTPDYPAEFARFTDPAIAGFLRHLCWRAQRLGVEFRLVDAPSLPYNGNDQVPVSGFFVENPSPVLGVAIGKDPEEWLEILAHESSHMDQWAQGCAAWTNNIMPDGREAVDWIDDWISGKEFESSDLRQAFDAAKEVELDCERRTLSKIRSFALPVSADAYAQRANAYVHFYAQVAQTRKWNETGKAPYQIEEVWSKAPTEMVDEPTPELAAAYERFWPSSAAAQVKPVRRRP